MNETLKQNRLLTEHGDDRLFPNPLDDKDNGSDLQKNVSNFGLDGHEEISDGRSALYTLERNHINSQKEWHIDFSELTVGTRVGIGKHTMMYGFLDCNLSFKLPYTAGQ
ncbi:MITOGEN ACTIVATED PROTEIN KINASE KINASE KINASE-LIKE PROTEIN-RELATED [Salix viminalis]|uniref:MITOGEN ACTIVATED PROTEIN KINASE KINASE KINASE-LIKE PROTEIN-RELATED n=1 Tax=Salix viminalis TaxID=40686 RepID=A0A9Q0NRX2_SALVM|nr:MITOGEN ACTIVATED PROTEIN KINASE KINASE KINASE-LIKE PROTEIN-RELATED [Salix viminalis]